jgi:hypothetical protein
MVAVGGLAYSVPTSIDPQARDDTGVVPWKRLSLHFSRWIFDS